MTTRVTPKRDEGGLQPRSSHSLQILGFKGPVPTVPELAEQWNQRNQSVLDALPFYPDHITIVRYEDLSDSPSMLAALGERLGIEALLNFRGDSACGRRNMAREFQTLVDAVTRDTRARLDAARSIMPGPVAALARSAPQVSGGVLSTTVAGTQVLFDGTPAPLLSVQANQVSAIVPYEVAGEASSQMQIVVNGNSSAVVSVPVTNTAPGIFTQDQSGVEQCLSCR